MSAGDPLKASTESLARAEARTGVLYGIAAYGAWGVFPLYFKWLAHVPPLEVLSHRVVWSVLLLGGLLHLRGQWASVRSILRRRSTMLTMLATTLLIGFNWGLFIYAIVYERLMQASLGYFINPLVNVLLGYLLLSERLRPLQVASVAVATGGVGVLTWHAGGPPLIALALAVSFGFYGLLRKTAPVEPIAGLFVETTLLAPLGAAFLVFHGLAGDMHFGNGPWIESLGLLAGGAITATPLIWFANAARRLKLATIGFLQYLAPTGQFLLAVAFGEPFTRAQAGGFGLIWVALAVYSLDAVLRLRMPMPSKRSASAQPSSVAAD
jgi:chloramphenicol-sensitive protein RarD